MNPAKTGARRFSKRSIARQWRCCWCRRIFWRRIIFVGTNCLTWSKPESKTIKLTCLYLRKANVDLYNIDFTLDSGAQVSVNLTQYQGLNSPKQPIAAHPAADQDEMYAQAARELKAILEAPPLSRPLYGQRYNLTIQLQRRDPHLTRIYLRQRRANCGNQWGCLSRSAAAPVWRSWRREPSCSASIFERGAGFMSQPGIKRLSLWVKPCGARRQARHHLMMPQNSKTPTTQAKSHPGCFPRVHNATTPPLRKQVTPITITTARHRGCSG